MSQHIYRYRSYSLVGHSQYTNRHRKIGEIENVLLKCRTLSMLSDTNIQEFDGIKSRGVAKSEGSNVCVFLF
jgi:hypothetical protein